MLVNDTVCICEAQFVILLNDSKDQVCICLDSMLYLCLVCISVFR